MILTNTNTYTGGTTISAATTLQLGDGVSAQRLGHRQHRRQRPVGVRQPPAQTLTAARSAARAACWPAAPACSPSPPPTRYTGGTTVSANATLQLGDGASDNGSVTGNISDNGLLDLQQPVGPVDDRHDHAARAA